MLDLNNKLMIHFITSKLSQVTMHSHTDHATVLDLNNKLMIHFITSKLSQVTETEDAGNRAS